MPKILLVEDDNNLREIFEMRLKAEGYETVTAGNGEEALDVAMKQRPDLIIADVMMPKLSGFEMLESLRAVPEMANTKAVMMTALGQAEDRARGERLGVIKYLVKSQVTLEDFVRVVRDVLNPSDSATEVAAANDSSTNSNQQINQESEAKMPEDTSTNPAPAGGDNNPISGTPSEPSTQQTTEQEQTAVQDQINSFVSAPVDPGASDATPSTDVTAGPAAPAAPASSDAAGMGDAATPASDSGAADTTGTQPPADTGPADNPAGPAQPPASTEGGAGNSTL